MTLRVFNRSALVTVATPRPDANFFSDGTNAIEIRDLRVQFSIEKRLKSKKPNTADIVITNLNEDSRKIMARKPLHVTLTAGHDGELRRLASGDVRWSQSNHDGVDWSTLLQIADGDRAFRHARVNKSYRAGTPIRTVLRDCAQAMGLTLPKAVDLATELDAPVVAGETLSGRCSDELTRLLAPYGFDAWTIEGGQLVVQRDTDARAEQALLVRPPADGGTMIGRPELSAPSKAGKPPTLQTKIVMDPRVLPGGRIVMQTRAITGTFKVVQVLHRGDTHGEDWYTEIEAQPA